MGALTRTEYQERIEIGLLIGSNCPKAIKPQNVIPGNEEDPYAIKTLLGWGIIGPVSTVEFHSLVEDELSCNRINMIEIVSQKQSDVTYIPESHMKKIINPSPIIKIFELDFNEGCDPAVKYFSVDDQTFLTKVSEGIHLREDGHYEIPLPFKENDIKLPNNIKVSSHRLQQLKSRLERHEKYKADYVAFMNDMINEGYAERVPSTEVTTQEGKCW